MTRVVDVAEPESPIAPKHPKLQFETATLQDLLIVDKRTGFPIPDVHITVSDASIHLVAYRKKTDEDGYAVIPMISAQPLSISLRSNGYLAQNAIPLRLRLDNSIQGAGAPEEIVIELDPGVQIAGTVNAPSGAPAPDATIHAIIRQKNSRLWYSDLDNPLPITAFSGNVRSIIVPQRASYSTNTRGKFLVTPLPPGKMTIYATHPNYAPSAPIDIDARDDAQLPAIELSLKPMHTKPSPPPSTSSIRRLGQKSGLIARNHRAPFASPRSPAVPNSTSLPMAISPSPASCRLPTATKSS